MGRSDFVSVGKKETDARDDKKRQAWEREKEKRELEKGKRDKRKN